MIVVLPTPSMVLASLAAHPVLMVVVLLVGVVLVPAVWSRRPERRCAGAAALATLVAGAVAVAQLALVAAAQPGRLPAGERLI